MTARADMMRADRPVLRLWLATRIATFFVAAASGYLFAKDNKLTPYLQRWQSWDVAHYEHIAEFGYAAGTDPPREAFFPGFPMVLRLLHAVGIDLTVAGLLVSFVAGGIAVIALARLAEERGPTGAGERAVLLLLLSPMAVFLAAGYTEALFMALAFPAWLAARRGNWWLAGALAAGATAVRVNGLFLLAALVVEYAVGRPGRSDGEGGSSRRWSDAPALLLPLLPPAAYSFYLHRTQGDWLAWIHAQEEGWDRRFTPPVTAFRTTWDAAFGEGLALEFQWAFRAELIAVLIGVLLTAYLLWARQWSEATYIGVTLLAFVTSTWYFSVPRSMLLWWPLWVVLAQATLRRPWALTVYLTLIAPLSVVWVLLFVTYRWAG